MKDSKLVWSDEKGDLRKSKSKQFDGEVNEADLELYLRRLTSGKGRTILEISNLPNDKSWCKSLAKELKKSLGVGGAYKNDIIEVHGEKEEPIKSLLDKKNIRYKKTGG